MSNYLHFDGTADNYVRATVTDMDGEDQFDIRYDIEPTALSGASGEQRVAGDSNAVVYLELLNDNLRFSSFDGANHVFDSSADVPYSAGDRFQVRAVADFTSNPLLVDFYTRDSGTDLAVNTGWNALGAQQTEADTFTGVASFTQTNYDIGNGQGAATQPIVGGIYQVLCMYDHDNKIFADVDLRVLTAAELAAGEFVADDSLTWTFTGDEWAYVRPLTSGVLADAELLLMADDGNEGYSPKWADRSGNDHHAQLGSAAGDDVNDPESLPWAGQNHVKLSGVADNFMSTPVVNLLDADTAHTYQSIGNWISNTGPAATHEIDVDAFGGMAAVNTPTSSTVFLKTSASAAVNPSVTATNEYTLIGSVKIDSTGPTENVRMAIDWRDVGDTSLGVDQGSPTALVVGEYVHSAITATAPTDAVYARTFIYAGSDEDFDGTQEWSLSKSCFREGADTTFVPSQKLNQDLDVRIKFNDPDYASTNGLMAGKWTGGPSTESWGIRRSVNGVISFDMCDGSTEWWGENNTLPGGITYFKALLDLGAAEVRTYVTNDPADWGSPVTDSTVGAVLNGNNTELNVGCSDVNQTFFDGDIYWMELRDGIDGPVVARYSAADAAEPFATQVGAVDSLTWTYNRSGAGNLYVVDQPSFGLHTDDYFDVPDHAGLQFGASTDSTWMVLARTGSAVVAGSRLLSKRITAGWELHVSDVGAVDDGTAFFGDTGSFVFADSTNDAPGDWALRGHATVFTGRENGSLVEIFIDGTVRDNASTVGMTASSDSGGNLTLGAGNIAGYDSFLDGEIMAVAIWRRALTDGEIVAAGKQLRSSYGSFVRPLTQERLIIADGIFASISKGA